MTRREQAGAILNAVRQARAAQEGSRRDRAPGDPDRARIAELERELMRIVPQLAALEERVERLARRSEPAPEATDADRAEARSLVEEVRAEHARVRARISAATVFEERLRVVEEQLGIDSLTGRRGD